MAIELGFWFMPDKSEHPPKRAGGTNPSKREEKTIKTGANQHVIRRDNGWAVRTEGSKSDNTIATTQRAAIEHAREIVQRTGSGTVVIHSRDGKIVGREVFRNIDWELEEYVSDSESEQTDNQELSKYIDTTYYGERPHIRGRRVLVSMIAANAEANGWSISRLAGEFSLSEEQVLAALLYYREHKPEIDRQDAEEQAIFDEIYRIHNDAEDS
jgi:uncharacterized protein (DUF433 family)